MTLISILPGVLPAALTALLIYQFIILPIYKACTSPLRHLPGPKLTLFTQNYITFMDFLNLRTKTLHKWHSKYGPIVRVGPNEVSFTSPTAVKQIYQDPAMEKDTRLYGQFKHFGADSAFSSRTRLQHGWRRKGVGASLSRSRIFEHESTERLIGSVVGRYLEVIERNSKYFHIVKDLQDRKLVDVYLLNKWFACDVVTGFVFGPRGSKTLCLDIESAECSRWEKPSYHRKLVKECYQPTLRSHTYLYVEFPNLMCLVDRLESIWDFTIQRVQTILGRTNHDSSLEDFEVDYGRVDGWGWKNWKSVKNEDAKIHGGPNSFCVAEVLSKLVADSCSLPSGCGDAKPQEGIWTDEVAVSELMDQILAGMDTTSDTLSFLIYHLSLPASAYIQTALHDELVTAFPPSSPREDIPPFFTCAPISGSSYTKYSQFVQNICALPYLDAVIKETLRLYTAIPGTLPRIVPTDSSQGKFIDGVYLPSGTVVGTFAYGIHRDQSIFGSDNFEPERWLPRRSWGKKSNEEDWSGEKIGGKVCHEGALTNTAEVETERVKEMEKRLWAFGSGGRICVGRNLAVLEIKMLLATIFWRYKTVVVGDKEAETFGKLDHCYWDHREAFRDVMPFKGVNGIVAFFPYQEP